MWEIEELVDADAKWKSGNIVSSLSYIMDKDIKLKKFKYKHISLTLC